MTKTLFVIDYNTMADLLYTGFKKDSSTFLGIMRNQSKFKGETWHINKEIFHQKKYNT